jgi:Ribbon-helix-helix protein, copG family
MGLSNAPMRAPVPERGLILIRDVPDDVVAALEAHARRLGLSRTEYVRRRLAQDAAVSDSPVSAGDLARSGDTFSDQADPEVASVDCHARRADSTTR